MLPFGALICVGGVVVVVGFFCFFKLHLGPYSIPVRDGNIPLLPFKIPGSNPKPHAA